MRLLPYPRTMRARLTLWNMLLSALILVFLGIVLRMTATSNLMASVDANLDSLSDPRFDLWIVLSDANHAPPERRTEAGTPEKPALREVRGVSLKPLLSKPPRRIVLLENVFDLKGRKIYPDRQGEPWDRSAFEKAVHGEKTFTTVLDGDKLLRVYSLPLKLKSGEVAGVTQTTSSLDGFERALGSLDRTLLTLFPVGLMAAGLGGAFLMGRILRSMREVTQTAAQIGAHDLSQRITLRGQDEFSELAAIFNAMLARLETSFEQQRRFTADASHELRTPLTVVKSVASRFLSRKDLPEDYSRGIERLDRAADVMELLVKDLLLLARSDAGQLQLELTPIALSSVLEMALAGVTIEEGPAIQNEVASSRLMVLGEADHLSRLFTNLLANAVRHTPPEGRITVTARQEGHSVTVSISDTGTGIPAEHLPYITKRFYRVDTARARTQGGTGLGLAICQSIAVAHGGEMHIQSVEGQSTAVRVTLQLSEAGRP